MLEMWFPPSDPSRHPIQIHALYVFLLKISRHLNNKNKIKQKQKKTGIGHKTNEQEKMNYKKQIESETQAVKETRLMQN